MPACQECHRVKVRCDRDQSEGRSCSRCLRLEVDCIARVSRQGQGPKRRRKLSISTTASEEQDHAMAIDSQPQQQQHGSEDGQVLDAIMMSTPSEETSSLKFHYGMRYLIHSWTSFALARRSFPLLSRASRLAAKCEVPMDDIFCASRQDIIDPILYGGTGSTTQSVAAAPFQQNSTLQWNDLPTALLQVCGASSDRDRQNRYMMVREAKNGHSRFLVSDCFQQEIASLWLMEQTWKANDKPVVTLFLQGPTDFDKFTKAIHYTLSRYNYPEKKPECVRVNGVYVKFQKMPNTCGDNNVLIQKMDLVYALEIVTLEHSFYICELVHPKKGDGHIIVGAAQDNNHGASMEQDRGHVEPVSTCSHQQQANQEPVLMSDSDSDPLHLFDNLVPLEQMDPDFESFLAVLKE
ncbi:expressed unknown protein [Seminavis robusta]|uniref:Zn(2)-C6 fungal-type domain-containing protein n=1 Tax=Seminavis robusta TaxID=568900 RepID=A0A9N8DG14_9STRA|nr:expressed unknown protein [Seminavis robusta]|eukprot:Sro73_g040540.1 n/a (407) ;mRNA; f:125599-126819